MESHCFRPIQAARLASVEPVPSSNDTSVQLSMSRPLSRSRANSSMPPPALPGRQHFHSKTSSTSSIAFSHQSHMPYHAHTRSMSHADVANRQSKRLSLNFPIQTAAGSIPETPRSRPASWISNSSRYSDSVQPATPPATSDGSFFTALAAQERRVLELREELAKAEERLKELKRQWSSHDGSHKRKDLRGFTPLPPLNTGLANFGVIDDAVDGETNWMHKEMERRKAILSGQRQSNRKVFSGSRHTRTLSLLSPARDISSPITSQPLNADPEVPSKSQRLIRSSTSPDAPPDPSDDLLRTGRQIATDFKDGLWTFIEDLRQATVGDEAVNGVHTRSGSDQELRRQPSGVNVGSSTATNLGRSKSLGHTRKPKTLAPSGDGSSLIDIETSFWKEHGIEEPAPPKPAVVKRSKNSEAPQTARNRTSQNFEDSWEDWDAPAEPYKSGHSSANNSISLSEGRTSPPCSERSSPRTSTSSTAGMEALPELHNAKRNSGKRSSKRASTNSRVSWPALKTLSPSNLGRAASHLMNEWERSLASPTSCAEAEALQDYISYQSPKNNSKDE